MTELYFLIAGFAGALIGAQLRDGGIEIPSIQKIKNGSGRKLCLGGLVGLFAGALAGMYADNTIWNAACYGFAGAVIIQQGAARIIDGFSRKNDKKE